MLPKNLGRRVIGRLIARSTLKGEYRGLLPNASTNSPIIQWDSVCRKFHFRDKQPPYNYASSLAHCMQVGWWVCGCGCVWGGEVGG